MEKIIKGFIKFYIIYALFGVLAIIILYASADLKCFLETGESFFYTAFCSPESFGDDDARTVTLRFWMIAFQSVPGEAFLEGFLGISFDSNMVPDVTGAIVDVFSGGGALSKAVGRFIAYDDFWREMAVATCASMVMYAVIHLKDLIKTTMGADVSAWLAWVMASVFWIFAGYTFGEVLVYALEMRVAAENHMILYIIMTVVIGSIEAVIHAYGNNGFVWRLLVALVINVFCEMQKAMFVADICATVISIATAFFMGNVEAILRVPLGMLVIIMSSLSVIFITWAKGKLMKLLDKNIGEKRPMAAYSGF